MLDERLQLAADLYVPCDVGADIGTDHAQLPCYLLEQNICRRMILSDVSPKAFQRAVAEVQRRGLNSRVRLVCASGLDALTESADCVSIMGMGGQTIAEILHGGASRLSGATLVLSAHTDQQQVRQAIQDIGYHIEREELCRAAGRFYVFWRCVPGQVTYTAEELDMGPLLPHGSSPLLPDYLRWRLAVLMDKRAGLTTASTPDTAAVALLDTRIAAYRQALKEVPSC